MISDFENILLSKARDIRGPEEVSMFPLAIGWWGLIILLALGIIIYAFNRIQRARYKKTWKYKTYKKLDIIRDELNEDNVKESIAKITEILKRISIQEYGRKEVASLTGEQWLYWLEARDPNHSSWKKYKEILLDYPYMQSYKIEAKIKEVQNLIKSIKEWL